MRRLMKFGALFSALILAATACARATETKKEESGISLVITEPPGSGLLMLGNVVDLGLKVSGIKIVAAKDDPGTGGTGHFHVFIDKDPVAQGEVIPSGDPSIVHTADNPIKLTGFSVGEHRFVVVLGDKKHVRIGKAEAERKLKFEGPSVDATAPATARVGESVKIDVKVEGSPHLSGGVSIIAAADDKSNKDGTAGHLHVFVNKDPSPVGTPIPTGDPAIIHTTSTSIEIPGNLLKVGENIFWIVLGYADHTPFSPGATPPPEAKVAPPVLDKVVITVS